jgi:hypothetical protein
MTKVLFSLLLIGIVSSSVVGCSTPLKTFNNVPIGASKAYVVNELGSPRRTYRKESVDHWFYVFPGEDGQRIERELLFENGVVISKAFLGKPKESDWVPVD